MPVSMEGFSGKDWALPFLQGVTGAWMEGRRCFPMDGTAKAIPSTLSVCPTTPTGRFPSWITPKIPRIGQKEGSPQGIRDQPTLLALPGIWSWDPKEGKSQPLPRREGIAQSRHSASGNHYCYNCALYAQGWIGQWPPRICRQTQGY